MKLLLIGAIRGYDRHNNIQRDISEKFSQNFLYFYKIILSKFSVSSHNISKVFLILLEFPYKWFATKYFRHFSNIGQNFSLFFQKIF